MKDAFYFPHDSNAHNDEKILKLRLRCDWGGVGLYWTLIEILRDSPTYKYPHDLATLELGLSTPQATLEATLEACFELGLMVKKDGFFSSPALDRRMEEVDAKREILREAGRRGGIKSRQAKATLKPGLSHPQAVKESKVKESKYTQTNDKSSFQKPTPEEVTEYAKSIGFVLEGSAFVDHYEAGGWMRGKTKIKDWRACVRTWRKIDSASKTTQTEVIL